MFNKFAKSIVAFFGDLKFWNSEFNVCSVSLTDACSGNFWNEVGSYRCISEPDLEKIRQEWNRAIGLVHLESLLVQNRRCLAKANRKLSEDISELMYYKLKLFLATGTYDIKRYIYQEVRAKSRFNLPKLQSIRKLLWPNSSATEPVKEINADELLFYERFVRKHGSSEIRKKLAALVRAVDVKSKSVFLNENILEDKGIGIKHSLSFSADFGFKRAKMNRTMIAGCLVLIKNGQRHKRVFSRARCSNSNPDLEYKRVQELFMSGEVLLKNCVIEYERLAAQRKRNLSWPVSFRRNRLCLAIQSWILRAYYVPAVRQMIFELERYAAIDLGQWLKKDGCNIARLQTIREASEFINRNKIWLNEQKFALLQLLAKHNDSLPLSLKYSCRINVESFSAQFASSYYKVVAAMKANAEASAVVIAQQPRASQPFVYKTKRNEHVAETVWVTNEAEAKAKYLALLANGETLKPEEIDMLCANAAFDRTALKAERIIQHQKIVENIKRQECDKQYIAQVIKYFKSIEAISELESIKVELQFTEEGSQLLSLIGYLNEDWLMMVERDKQEQNQRMYDATSVFHTLLKRQPASIQTMLHLLEAEMLRSKILKAMMVSTKNQELNMVRVYYNTEGRAEDFCSLIAALEAYVNAKLRSLSVEKIYSACELLNSNNRLIQQQYLKEMYCAAGLEHVWEEKQFENLPTGSFLCQ